MKFLFLFLFCFVFFFFTSFRAEPPQRDRHDALWVVDNETITIPGDNDQTSRLLRRLSYRTTKNGNNNDDTNDDDQRRR
jgi:hypothetical protein